MTKCDRGCISNYDNAMEPLVIEELEVQLQKLPVEEAEKINKKEAIAFALNRLPPLYSTTEEGWYWQQERALEKFPDLIAKMVAWAIRKTQKKPKGDFIRPLPGPDRALEGNFIRPLPGPNRASEAALEELKKLLVCQDLSWENLAGVVEATLIATGQRKINWDSYKPHKIAAKFPDIDAVK